MKFVQHFTQFIKRKQSQGVINDLDNVDFISSNVNSSRKEALLEIFGDNEAVIKMIVKGRSPSMRHVSRTHRVLLDWLFHRINLDPKIQIKYIDTKNQLADMLTGEISLVMSGTIFCVCSNISHFSSINKSKAMSKRTPERRIGAGSSQRRRSAESNRTRRNWMSCPVNLTGHVSLP